MMEIGCLFLPPGGSMGLVRFDACEKAKLIKKTQKTLKPEKK
jgi:hypothetical protein